MPNPSARMLALLSLLQVRRDWPGALLADRLGVSPRTVRRDVDQLRELGYAVRAVKGPDGGYRLDAGSELPPLLFDDDQVVALTVALQTLPAFGAELGEAAERALGTVRRVLPARLRERVAGLEVRTFAGEAGPGVDPAVLEAVSGAVHRSEVLRFEYAGAAGTAGTGGTGGTQGSGTGSSSRRVEPHGVLAAGGRWYLAAWDLDRAAWRAFRLDRMTPRAPTRLRFERRALPGGSVEAFLRRRFRGSATGEWPCVGEAVVAVDARAIAPYLALRDGDVEDLGDEGCLVRVGAWSWIGVASRIAAFDAPFEVVGPPALADAVRTLAARLAHAA